MNLRCRSIWASVTFPTREELRSLIKALHTASSTLGGDRESVVVRVSGEITTGEFARSVCKSVHRDHVRTDVH